MKKRILSFLITFCMIFTLIPISVYASAPNITGNSVYRESATTATIRFMSDTTGVAYYKITDSSTPPEDILNNVETSFSVSANVTTSINLTGLSSGAKYAHIVVTHELNKSNVLTIAMPYDIYYFEDFEAYNVDTIVPTSSSDITSSTPQLYLKYNGYNSALQKVILSGTNKVLNAYGTYARGLDERVNFGSPISSGFISYEADVTIGNLNSYAINFGCVDLGNSNDDTRNILFGISDNSKKFFAHNNNTRTFTSLNAASNNTYKMKIIVDVANKKYDVYVDGNKLNSTPYDYNIDEIKWFGFYNGSGTVSYDNVKMYVTNTNPTTYTVTFDSNGGSTVASQTITNGDFANEPIEPTKDGHYFNGWYLDADDLTLEPFDFVNTQITSAINLYARWSKIFYTITGEPTTNGTFTIKKGTSEVNGGYYGDTITITPKPEPEYRVKSVKRNNSTAGITQSGNDYIFTMTLGNINVYVEFERIPVTTYTVTKGTETNGTFVVDNTTAPSGETVTITGIIPSAGYQLKEVKILKTSDNSNITTTVGYNGTNKTFTMPAYPVIVTVEFEKITYSATLENTTNGTLSVNNQTASSGDTITITAKPNDGYKIKSIKILKASDNSNITSLVAFNSANNTFTMPSYAVNIYAEFEKIETNIHRNENLKNSLKSEDSFSVDSRDEYSDDKKSLFIATGDNLPINLYFLILAVSSGLLIILETVKKKLMWSRENGQIKG